MLSKSTASILVLLLLAGIVAPVMWAQEEKKEEKEVGEFSSPILLRDRKGQPIDAGDRGHAAPFFIDIDLDGKRDLLVGDFNDGYCRVFLNRGTDTYPIFYHYGYKLFSEGEFMRIPFT